MAGVIGGRLFRLVENNFYVVVESGLRDLGWFDPNRRHKPVTVIPESIDPDDDLPIEPNLVSVSFENAREFGVELGTNLSENVCSAFVDIYAESKAVGMDLAGEVKDIIGGRYSAASLENPSFPIMNFSQATPTEISWALVSDIEVVRNRFYSSPHKRYWWTVACNVTYYYSDDR